MSQRSWDEQRRYYGSEPRRVPQVTRSAEDRERCLKADTVIRYVVTHIGRNGLRTLSSASQGRWTYATREEAQAVLESMLQHNSPELLRSLYGSVDSFAVRACECWPGHFDPKRIYFDEEV